MRANTSSGQPTIRSSALGMRSRVANFARASATIVRQPSCFATAQSASAVSTAPTTRRRGGGSKTSAKTRRPSCSSTVLRPDRRRAPTSAASSGGALPPPAPRQRVDQLLVGLLDEDVDPPAARQADLESDVVRDPVREQARL